MILTFEKSDVFPVGTTVGAYPANARHDHGVKPSGAAVETHEVPTSGTLGFSTLALGVRYVLFGLVGGTEPRYVYVSNVPYVAPPVRLLDRIKAQRELVGAV